MSMKWIAAALAVTLCGGQMHAAYGRGGSSRYIMQRMQQAQQQMQKQQAQIAAQQKAELEAAEKKHHERQEASAAANREIKRHEKERGDRYRQRIKESTSTSRSKVQSSPSDATGR